MSKPMPLLRSAVMNEITDHGTSTVPTPSTGKMSTSAVMAARRRAYSVPIRVRPKNTTENVIRSIREYARR